MKRDGCPAGCQRFRGGASQRTFSARTVLAWVHTFGPLLAAEGRRHARPVGTRWWADGTYVRVGGRWAHQYRAVGEAADTFIRLTKTLACAV